MSEKGPSTRAIHAGLPDPVQGEPFLPGPVFAAPYHLRGPADAAPYGYGRDQNPTWTHLERAIGELDGGESVVFSSGMAAVTRRDRAAPAAGRRARRAARRLPGHPQAVARSNWCPAAIEVRLVPTDTDAIVAASEGATLVWVETPSNPKLDQCDLDTVIAAAHSDGALVGVDNTVATPLGRRPLDHGADFAMVSGTKSLTGHSDLLMGAVSVRDEALAGELRAWRSHTGASARPVRGLARAPLARHARAAARALSGQRPRRGRGARRPRRRHRCALARGRASGCADAVIN